MAEKLRCEQLIYTSALLGGRGGYQVVASSRGWSDSERSEVLRYVYPAGLSPGVRFDESRQMLTINNKVALSLVKNIGVGFDGRGGTLYNHTILLSQEDYLSLGADPEILENAFIVDKDIRETLPSEIAVGTPDSRVQGLSGSISLADAVDATLTSSTTPTRTLILVDEGTNRLKLIRNIIASLPPAYRLVAFTTFVVNPQQDLIFKLMLMNEEY